MLEKIIFQQSRHVSLFLTAWAGEVTQQVAEGSRESSAPHFYVVIPPAWHSRAEERKKENTSSCPVLQGRTIAVSQTDSACNNNEMSTNSSFLLYYCIFGGLLRRRTVNTCVFRLRNVTSYFTETHDTVTLFSN
jgi:hypothetical protein